MSTTTPASSIINCPVNSDICKNGGECLVIGGVSIFCSCKAGFTGKKNLKLKFGSINLKNFYR